MRLTLRMMLAYMDDILEPEDAQLIGKKIEESEFATGLLHRARDCMRRLRLGAPGVMEEGKGLDPNTVAEYLDHTLAPDRVPDFERVCLESDVHLAEVASCHQILTMVLREPAEVDPESRLRMYGLAERTAAAPIPPELPPGVPGSDGHKGAAPIQDETPRAKPELPEYLRTAQTQRRRLRLVVAAILLLALGVGVLMFGQTRKALLARLGLGTQEPVPAEQAPVETPVGPTPAAELNVPPGGVKTPAEPAVPPAEARAGVATKPQSSPPPASVQPTIPAESERVVVSPLPPGSQVPAEPKAAGALPSPASPEMPPPPQAPATPAPEAVATIPAEPLGAEPAMAPPATLPADSTAEPAPLPREPVGQFVSPNAVFLRLAPESGAWWRITEQTPLVSGDTFQSLPTYRSSIVVKNDIRVLLVGDARVRLLATDAGGVAGLAIDRGRLVIRTADQPEGKLRLQIGDRGGMIALGDAESEAALEVGRRNPSNADPATAPAPLAADLFATSGTVSWTDQPSGEAIAVAARCRLSLDQSPLAVAPATELPKWVGTNTVSWLDQRASSTVAEQLTGDRPAGLTLRELAGHRQKEVRRLALRCLSAIGDFELLVKALDNPDEKMSWPDDYHVDLLRAAVAQSPQAAAEVLAVMEKLHGDQGAELYRMLWGYSMEKLSREDAQWLVGYLDSEDLAFRRLSFWNLKRITRLGLSYQPEDTAAKRRYPVQNWKERIKDFDSAEAKPAEENRPAVSAETAPPSPATPAPPKPGAPPTTEPPPAKAGDTGEIPVP